VKPAPFSYHRPATIAEAIALLAELTPHDGRVLAGGQSLLPMMAFRLARPAHLIDINRVAGLDRVEVAEGRLRVGARVRHAAFHRPVAEAPLGALLTRVAATIAHYPIRMRGTFCGSLAHADPAADWSLIAVTLEAELVALSSRGERKIAAADFLQGVMETALAPGELLVEAVLPLPSATVRFGFAEFSRRAGDYAEAMALAALEVADGVIANPRLGIGGAEAVPRRLAAVEAALAGERPCEALFRDAAAMAAAAIKPLQDPRVEPEYRRELVGAMAHRALAQACR
jgi:carbon-monoxide dehydrogenase medium subunit